MYSLSRLPHTLIKVILIKSKEEFALVFLSALELEGARFEPFEYV